MKGFIDELAQSLYKRYGNDFSNWTIIFPSRRARIFFMESLSENIDHPIWQPQWASIDDLMCEISGLKSGDRLRLITELYKVYNAHHPEPFDKFYFWGEMLLNDFDYIDKYLINAENLFSNLVDIKEIESKFDDYMTEEQKQAIKSFCASLSMVEGGTLTDEQERFLAIWKSLYGIYDQFRKNLQQVGFAYGGMIQRSAVEKIKHEAFDFSERRHYIVAGFNALSKCERELFKFLQGHAETEFYWDYDNYYVKNPEQEAGACVRQNLKEFPSPQGVEIAHDFLSKDQEKDKNSSDEPKLVSVSTISHVAQCKYAARLVEEIAGEHWDKNTAVVLTDENLLMPLLYAMPTDVKKPINITMGYPLRSTMAYTFLERLIELQNHRRTTGEHDCFYHSDVCGLLAHPYVMKSNPDVCRKIREEIRKNRRISVDAAWLRQTPLLQAIFASVNDWKTLSDYLLAVLQEVSSAEYLMQEDRVFLSELELGIIKLCNSLNECGIELKNSIYVSLLRRHMQTLRIPFEGEPLQGVQVMGILETRNLDFDQVVILSMNDANFPGNHIAQASFIPDSLRIGHGLPTYRDHESVYAYYFYRLIQRARKVYMLYCSHADKISTGEPSRYIRQLSYESGLRMKRIDVGVDVHWTNTEPIEVPKSEEVMKSLGRFLGDNPVSMLSPTAFIRYISCPLKFYFASVARLSIEDEITEEIDARMFGTILHASAQAIYGPLADEKHPDHSQPRRALSKVSKDAVSKAVDAAINENYLCNPTATSADYSGNLLLVKSIVERYLTKGVLPFDAQSEPFTVVGVETSVKSKFSFISHSGEELVMNFAGFADRIDRLSNDVLRAVDYKTGEPHLEFNGLDSLFHGETASNFSNVVQILLYCMMLANGHAEDSVPALYYVRKIHQPGFSPLLNDKTLKKVGVHFSEYREEFERLVREVLKEIYDKEKPFVQCKKVDTCKYCDFNTICRRQKDLDEEVSSATISVAEA